MSIFEFIFIPLSSLVSLAPSRALPSFKPSAPRMVNKGPRGGGRPLLYPLRHCREDPQWGQTAPTWTPHVQEVGSKRPLGVATEEVYFSFSFVVAKSTTTKEDISPNDLCDTAFCNFKAIILFSYQSERGSVVLFSPL